MPSSENQSHLNTQHRISEKKNHKATVRINKNSFNAFK